MQEEGFPFARVVAMSGSGQQHGSVYWKKGSEGVLGELNPTATLASQLEVRVIEAFSTNSMSGACSSLIPRPNPPYRGEPGNRAMHAVQ